MQNLCLCSSSSTCIPDGQIIATAIDLDQNVLYVASERQNLDGEVQVEILKLPFDEEGNTTNV